MAGADERAVALARRALILVDEPQTTAELRSVIGLAEMRGGRPLEGLPALVDAAREVAPTDPAKAFELLMWASWAAMWSRDVGVQVEAARLAATFAPPGGDEESTFVANLLAGFAAMTQGDFAEGTRLLVPALDWGATATASLHVFQASMGAFWLGNDERVDALLSRTEALARERGEVGILAEALGIKSGQLVVAQRFDQTALTGSEGIELSRELGAENLELLPRAVLALVAAIRGQGRRATAG